MGKKKIRCLCKWSKDGDIEKDLKKIRKVVANPTRICRKCARVAVEDGYLCKPIPLGAA